MTSPCYECEDRVFGCFGSCERYQTWLAEVRAKNKKNVVVAYVQERMDRDTRRRRR